jgi:formylmethanofuran dehydrogenase subunit E
MRIFHSSFLLCIVSLFVAAALFISFTSAANQQEVLHLPKPYYEPAESDPAWLRTAVQVHGHLGPAVIFGVRIGAAGLEAVGASGYFDVEVIAEGPFAVPPKSCILDGLQISTGATLGKRNLKVVETEDYVFRIKNRKTGKIAELRPLPEVLKLMWSRLETDSSGKDNHDEYEHNKNGHKKDDTRTEMQRVEAVARQIAVLPLEKIASVVLEK